MENVKTAYIYVLDAQELFSSWEMWRLFVMVMAGEPVEEQIG